MIVVNQSKNVERGMEMLKALEIFMGIFFNAAIFAEMTSIIGSIGNNSVKSRFITLTFATGFLLAVIYQCVKGANIIALILFALGFMISYASFIFTFPEKGKRREKY